MTEFGVLEEMLKKVTVKTIRFHRQKSRKRILEMEYFSFAAN